MVFEPVLESSRLPLTVPQALHNGGAMVPGSVLEEVS
jgi:hypothetical protein